MFKVCKRTAGDIPDQITISMAYALVTPGVAVQLDGTLADAPDDGVAGICVSQHSITGAPGDATFSPTFPLGGATVDAQVVPVDRQTLIEADVQTPAAAIVVGYDCDLHTDGASLVANAAGEGDFHVVEIVQTEQDLDPDAATDYATIVRGFFMNPAYYV